jgi:exoribonuclease R
MHHQIKHHLAHGGALFQEGQLQVVAASAQAAIGDARRCERESTRFWLLRLLEGRQGEVVSGQVVRAQYRRLFVELDETLLFVPLNNAPPLPLGTPVQVSLNHINARRDTLSVKLVDSQT